MSKILDNIYSRKRQSHTDDVFVLSQKKDAMFISLEQYHQILQNKNIEAAPDNSHFFRNTRKKY